MTRIAYFGLPLGACLLAHDGLAPSLVVLSPTDAPGRRRLARVVDGTTLDAQDFAEPGELERAVDTELGAAPPDLLVSWYYTRKLPERWLAAARLGAVGVHPSILPRHRGPNPFYAAIDSGDAVTGVSVHRLVAAYDEGDVLATEAVPVAGRDAWQLARALDRPSLRLLRRTVAALVAGHASPGVPQDPALATWAPEPSGEALRADLSWPTERVLRRIRALSPVPGLALEIRGQPLFVTRAEVAREFPAALAPGEAGVLPGAVVLRTGDGAIRIVRATIEDPDTGEAEEVTGEGLAARLVVAGPRGGRAGAGATAW